jgi:hypothetical protein
MNADGVEEGRTGWERAGKGTRKAPENQVEWSVTNRAHKKHFVLVLSPTVSTRIVAVLSPYAFLRFCAAINPYTTYSSFLIGIHVAYPVSYLRVVVYVEGGQV